MEDLNLNVIFSLPPDEKIWWKKTIVKYRKRLVKAPKSYVESALKEMGISPAKISSDPNDAIKTIRENAWEHYILDEVTFHNEILAFLIESRESAAIILTNLIKSDYAKLLTNNSSPESKTKDISKLIGNYTGRIMPYIYELTLSTTNSRRSRSGKTFEAIIRVAFESSGIPFEDQKSLGKSFYEENKLGKMVDMIVPSKDAYQNRRRETLVVTMKTSLRERWAEVAEEIQRTKIPNIHLLTLDEDISLNLLQIMDHHNITLVVYDQVKNSKFVSSGNVISFTDFFKNVIPHYLSFHSAS